MGLLYDRIKSKQNLPTQGSFGVSETTQPVTGGSIYARAKERATAEPFSIIPKEEKVAQDIHKLKVSPLGIGEEGKLFKTAPAKKPTYVESLAQRGVESVLKPGIEMAKKGVTEAYKRAVTPGEAPVLEVVKETGRVLSDWSGFMVRGIEEGINNIRYSGFELLYGKEGAEEKQKKIEQTRRDALKLQGVTGEEAEKIIEEGGYKDITSYQDIADIVRKDAIEHGASETGARTAAGIAVFGMIFIDNPIGAPAKTFAKKVAKETTEEGMAKLLKKEFKNITDDEIKALTPVLVNAKTEKEVQSIFGAINKASEDINAGAKVSEKKTGIYARAKARAEGVTPVPEKVPTEVSPVATRATEGKISDTVIHLPGKNVYARVSQDVADVLKDEINAIPFTKDDIVHLSQIDRVEGKAREVPLDELFAVSKNTKKAVDDAVGAIEKKAPVPEVSARNFAEEAKKYKSAEEFVGSQLYKRGVYHGSPVRFTEKELKTGAGDIIFFTSSKNEARAYAAGAESRVKQFALDKNIRLKEVDSFSKEAVEKARTEGYDGISYTTTPRAGESVIELNKKIDSLKKEISFMKEKDEIEKWSLGKRKDYPKTPLLNKLTELEQQVNPRHTVLFDKTKIKTKSQLTDIYNKAKEAPEPERKVVPEPTAEFEEPTVELGGEVERVDKKLLDEAKKYNTVDEFIESQTKDGYITVYHRTNANISDIEKIGFRSKENTKEIFVSSIKDGQAEGYGKNVIPLRIKEDNLRIDDEFPSGEVHYAAKITDADTALKERVHLTDIFNKAKSEKPIITTADKVKKAVNEVKAKQAATRRASAKKVAPRATLTDIAEIKRAVKRVEESNIGEIESNIAYLDELISDTRARLDEHPGKKLGKYKSRKEGDFLDLATKTLGTERTRTEAKAIFNAQQKVRKIEDILNESGFAESYARHGGSWNISDQVRAAIEEFENLKGEFDDLVTQRSKLRISKREAKEAEKVVGKYTREKVAQARFEERVKARVEIKSLRERQKIERYMYTAAERDKYRRAINQIKDRRAQLDEIRELFGITEYEQGKFLGGRNVSTIPEKDVMRHVDPTDPKSDMYVAQKGWESIISDFTTYSMQTQRIKEARMYMMNIIENKDLKNWEALRAAMDLPALNEMTEREIVNFVNVLQKYEEGDIFLSEGVQRYIDRSKFKGSRTVREVLDALKDETGVANLPDLTIRKTLNALRDPQLRKRHPLLRYIVDRKNELLIEGEERIHAKTIKADELIKKARASRKRKVSEKIAPTDKKIMEYLEANEVHRGDLERAVDAGEMTQKELDEIKFRDDIAKDMTPEELEAARYLQKQFRAYYDHLVLDKGLKSSRFKGIYAPHVRRKFLEAWKDDGFRTAVGEIWEKQIDNEKVFAILNDKTGDVLPYDKWLGQMQFRSQAMGVAPSKNMAYAFQQYVTAIERARALDEMVPELMAFEQAFHKGYTRKGIELDDRLQNFLKEYVNAAKGRVPSYGLPVGEWPDTVLRGLVAMVRMIDLGFSPLTQIAAAVGETVTAIRSIGAKAYARGVIRSRTKQGKAIAKKYESVIGRSYLDSVTEASKDFGEKLVETMYAGFSKSSRDATKFQILGSMSKAEYKTGEITAKRLNEMVDRMSRFRAIPGRESIAGKTSMSKALFQHKGWATPILQDTYMNIRTLISDLLDKEVKTGKALRSSEAVELYKTIGMGVATLAITYPMYANLKKKKDRNIVEDMAFRALREASTIMGAYDPRMWSKPRLVSFLDSVSKAVIDLDAGNLYKTFEPGAIRTVRKAITPEKPKQAKVSMPKGLPQLPSLKKAVPKLPQLPGLPTLNR